MLRRGKRENVENCEEETGDGKDFKKEEKMKSYEMVTCKTYERKAEWKMSRRKKKC